VNIFFNRIFIIQKHKRNYFKFFQIFLVITSIILLTPMPTLTWGAKGHEIIAELLKVGFPKKQKILLNQCFLTKM